MVHLVGDHVADCVLLCPVGESLKFINYRVPAISNSQNVRPF